VKRGPVAAGDATRAGVAHRGAANGRAKLSEHDAADILASYAAGMAVRDMAAVLGVTRATVYNIINGKAWRHLSVGADVVERERADVVRRRLGFVPSHVGRGL